MTGDGRKPEGDVQMAAFCRKPLRPAWIANPGLMDLILGRATVRRCQKRRWHCHGGAAALPYQTTATRLQHSAQRWPTQSGYAG